MNVSLLDTTFKPIPESLDVEYHTTILIGGDSCIKKPVYVLWRNNEEIVIESRLNSGLTDKEISSMTLKWYDLEKINKWTAQCLYTIKELLQTIEMGKSNWAYLVEGKYGPRLVYHNKIFKTITTPTWTTPIDISEIRMTAWGIPSQRRGWWRGKEVGEVSRDAICTLTGLIMTGKWTDILYAWDELNVGRVQRAITGFEATVRAGLDLIYDVYGHLIKNGQIVGLVQEATKGRPINPSDRELVYAAIAQLQSHGIMYKGCLTNNILVAEGKVRFTELYLLIPYFGNWDELQRDAEIWHWRELEELFQEFEDIGPFGLWRLPPLHLRNSPKNIQQIYPTFAPSKGVMFFQYDIFKEFGVDPWEGYLFCKNASEEDEPTSSATLSRKRRYFLKQFDASETDSTLRSANFFYNDNKSSRARNRRAIAMISHPYYRHRRPIGLVELTSSESTTSKIEEIDC